MLKKETQKPIYIVISQTGTALSRILKQITHREYNHASLSFCDDLSIMYSFGRKNPYNPFWAGFVKESADFGTFKRFSDTKVLVLKVFAEEEDYCKIKKLVEEMLKHSKDFGYNYLGLWLAAFKICFKSKHRFYCSEFVKEMLIKCNIDGADKLKEIVHPMHFLEIPNTQTVFCGKLSEYKLRENFVDKTLTLTS